MAWSEAALEELGLAPAWVRRGRDQADVQGRALDAAADAGADAAPAADTARTAHAAQAAEAGTGAAMQANAEFAPAAPHAETNAAPAVSAAFGDERASSSAAHARAAPDDAREGGNAGVPSGAPVVDERAAPEQPGGFAPSSGDDFAWPDFEPAEPAEAFLREADAPRETPIGELDWDELAARVADCRRCDLCEKRTQSVFGVGDRAADWLLVGEAPGENEDKQGEPFVGQAGKLLDNMLRALSLQRGENVYIANVIKCRPPGNRNTEPVEVARCEPYLQRQVELIKPKVIVALGRFAAQTLLKSDASIASLRSRVHEYEGVPVIVTYHPAYLLRSLPDKSKAWADLCLARATYASTQGAAAAPRADA